MTAPKPCPECGGEMEGPTDGWDKTVYYCRKCHIQVDAKTGDVFTVEVLETLWERGHEEKVVEGG